ncbi:MAG: hypothetical protein A2583_04275 [Bdellovibrionales bacterium RIFOXYD1_FULL_53_11]|nr:MAG: hypothetical protein A2583_04275 [Bdellovibrionales bacterium RIFOXYD1_FULL_53_11]
MKKTNCKLNPEKVISLLKKNHDILVGAYKIKNLGLFGSVARNEATARSDIDFLVEFMVPVGLFHLSRLARFLETLFHRRVDLVIKDSVRPEFREGIEKELIHAA